MSSVKFPVTTPSANTQPAANNPPVGTVTSSFFVQIGSGDNALVTSYLGSADDTDSLSSSAPLLWFHSIEERVSLGNAATDYLASSTLIHSLLELHIQTDSAMPALRQAMRNNDDIDQIVITRVGHLGKDQLNQELYSSTFTNCKLESVEEYPDKIIIKARVTTRYDVAATIPFDHAITPGNTGSGWDYQKNEPTADDGSGGGGEGG